MQTLFRGNSLGSKIMAFCFKIYGHNYLQNLLEPLITALLDQAEERTDISFEVDPARYVQSTITCMETDSEYSPHLLSSIQSTAGYRPLLIHSTDRAIIDERLFVLLILC